MAISVPDNVTTICIRSRMHDEPAVGLWRTILDCRGVGCPRRRDSPEIPETVFRRTMRCVRGCSKCSWTTFDVDFIRLDVPNTKAFSFAGSTHRANCFKHELSHLLCNTPANTSHVPKWPVSKVQLRHKQSRCCP